MLAAVLDTAAADFVCVPLDESVEERKSDVFDEVEELVERVPVIVRELNMVDVPVVVAMVVLPVSTLLACVTPIKADTVGSVESAGVPDEALELEPVVLVLVTSAAENNVFVMVMVGEPFGP